MFPEPHLNKITGFNKCGVLQALWLKLRKQTIPRSKWMPPKGSRKQPWVHPHLDPQCDVSRFIPMDLRDPRATRRAGPCHGHLEVLSSQDFLDKHKHELEAYVAYGGNPYGRWVDCNTCALRLGYWPKVTSTGSQRINTPRQIIMMALAWLRLQNPVEGLKHCEARMVRAAIQHIESMIKLQSCEAKPQLPKVPPDPEIPVKENDRPPTLVPGSPSSPSGPISAGVPSIPSQLPKGNSQPPKTPTTASSSTAAAECPAAPARRRLEHHRMDQKYVRIAKDLGIEEMMVVTDSEAEDEEA